MRAHACAGRAEALARQRQWHGGFVRLKRVLLHHHAHALADVRPAPQRVQERPERHEDTGVVVGERLRERSVRRAVAAAQRGDRAVLALAACSWLIRERQTA